MIMTWGHLSFYLGRKCIYPVEKFRIHFIFNAIHINKTFTDRDTKLQLKNVESKNPMTSKGSYVKIKIISQWNSTFVSHIYFVTCKIHNW